jgi:acetyl esterase/lipase
MTCHPQMFPGKLPERENVPIFNDTAGSIMLHTFVPNAADRTSLWLSPLLMDAATLQKLPPTYIDVCSADPFCIGGIAYAKRIEGLGVPVKLYVLKGMPHGSYILFPDLPSSQAAHTACMAGTEWALNCKK